MAKAKMAKAAKSAKGSKPPVKKKPARPPKPKKQREPYSILIPFLVVLLVLVGIFDLTLAFYIWLNRDKSKPKDADVSMGAYAPYIESYDAFPRSSSLTL